ncbi:MAG: hypothetical protein JXQ67_03655 [Campylobacterales bacterium]|nr:hypothetical protein [Campylobacterales bacterium]
MKYIAQLIVFLSVIAFNSGCSSTSTLPSMDAGVCNNPKCKCPKPCPCGAECQCGMNGNSEAMNGDK